MFQTIKCLIRNFGIYGKLDLCWFLRDTRYCLMQILCDLIASGSSIVGVFLLSIRFDGIGGMTREEILFMLGYATLVDGVNSLFFIGNNSSYISRIIGRGQLDHRMIQPVPLWIQLLTQGFCPASGSCKLLCGIALTAYSLHILDFSVSVLWIAGLIFSVVCSALIILSFTYLVSTLAFYAPVAAEEIAIVSNDLFVSLKSYPLGGIAPLWQGIFCTVLPVGLAAWFPSQVLLNQGQLPFAPLTAVAAAVFLAAASLFFRKGLIYYAKNSCPRYSGFGHR